MRLNYLKCCFNKPFCRALPLPDLTSGSREADSWRRRLHHQAFHINDKKPKHTGLTLQTTSMYCTHGFFYNRNALFCIYLLHILSYVQWPRQYLDHLSLSFIYIFTHCFSLNFFAFDYYFSLTDWKTNQRAFSVTFYNNRTRASQPSFFKHRYCIILKMSARVSISFFIKWAID